MVAGLRSVVPRSMGSFVLFNIADADGLRNYLQSKGMVVRRGDTQPPGRVVPGGEARGSVLGQGIAEWGAYGGRR